MIVTIDEEDIKKLITDHFKNTMNFDAQESKHECTLVNQGGIIKAIIHPIGELSVPVKVTKV